MRYRTYGLLCIALGLLLLNLPKPVESLNYKAPIPMVPSLITSVKPWGDVYYDICKSNEYLTAKGCVKAPNPCQDQIDRLQKQVDALRKELDHVHQEDILGHIQAWQTYFNQRFQQLDGQVPIVMPRHEERNL